MKRKKEQILFTNIYIYIYNCYCDYTTFLISFSYVRFIEKWKKKPFHLSYFSKPLKLRYFESCKLIPLKICSSRAIRCFFFIILKIFPKEIGGKYKSKINKLLFFLLNLLQKNCRGGIFWANYYQSKRKTWNKISHSITFSLFSQKKKNKHLKKLL